MRAEECFSYGVISGLKTILLDNHGYILKRKKTNKLEIHDDLIKENAENVLSGLENRKSIENSLEKYTEKKLNLETDLRSAKLDEYISGEISRTEIFEQISQTIAENMKPAKKVIEMTEEEDYTIHKSQVEIAMNKLKDRTFDYIENAPRRLLSLVDETHVADMKMKLQKYIGNIEENKGNEKMEEDKDETIKVKENPNELSPIDSDYDMI